jgi:hypothetical protein
MNVPHSHAPPDEETASATSTGDHRERNFALKAFLRTTANTVTKVRLLHFFLIHPEVCLSSQELAARLELDAQDVCGALQTLNDAGALIYSPSFGYSDLCLILPGYHTPAMKRDLETLRSALQTDADCVWHALAAG